MRNKVLLDVNDFERYLYNIIKSTFEIAIEHTQNKIAPTTEEAIKLVQEYQWNLVKEITLKQSY